MNQKMIILLYKKRNKRITWIHNQLYLCETFEKYTGLHLDEQSKVFPFFSEKQKKKKKEKNKKKLKRNSSTFHPFVNHDIIFFLILFFTLRNNTFQAKWKLAPVVDYIFNGSPWSHCDSLSLFYFILTSFPFFFYSSHFAWLKMPL